MCMHDIACMNAYVYIYIYVCIYVYMYACIYICMYVCLNDIEYSRAKLSYFRLNMKQLEQCYSFYVIFACYHFCCCLHFS